MAQELATKYLFNIGEDLYNLFNFQSEDTYNNFIFKSKKLLFTITDQFLELSTRSIVSTQTVIEKINSKENIGNLKNESKYKSAPKNIKEGIISSFKSIKKSVNKVINSDLPFTDKLVEPLIGLTEATSKSLMGIHNQLNKDKAYLYKNRYA